MTVVYEDVKHIYTCDVAQSDYVFKFKIPTDSDISVSKQLLASPYTLTPLVLTTDYTVTGAGESTGGNISLVTNLTSDYKIILLPAVAYDQQTDYTPYDKFPAVVHENALDKLCIQIKQCIEALNRCVQLDVGQEDQVTFSSGESGFFYTDGVNFSLLDEVVTTDLDYNGSFTHGADAAKSATPEIGDQYFATDTNKLYRCTSSNVWNIAALCSTLDASGNVTISGTVGVGGTLDVAGATSLASTLGFASGTTINKFSTDSTMAGNSDDTVPTEKAIVTYQNANKTVVSSPGTNHVTATSSTTTTSSTYEDLDSMALTFTPSHADNPILILFSAIADNSAAYAARFIVDISGNIASTASALSLEAGDFTPVAIQHFTTLAASSQTVKIMWKRDTSGTATCYQRRLTVIEFKQN